MEVNNSTVTAKRQLISQEAGSTWAMGALPPPLECLKKPEASPQDNFPEAYTHMHTCMHAHTLNHREEGSNGVQVAHD